MFIDAFLSHLQKEHWHGKTIWLTLPQDMGTLLQNKWSPPLQLLEQICQSAYLGITLVACNYIYNRSLLNFWNENSGPSGDVFSSSIRWRDCRQAVDISPAISTNWNHPFPRYVALWWCWFALCAAGRHEGHMQQHQALEQQHQALERVSGECPYHDEVRYPSGIWLPEA